MPVFSSLLPSFVVSSVSLRLSVSLRCFLLLFFLLLPLSVRRLLCNRVVFEVLSSSHFTLFPIFSPLLAPFSSALLFACLHGPYPSTKQTELEPNQSENASFNHHNLNETPSGVNFMNFLYPLTLLRNSRSCCICFSQHHPVHVSHLSWANGFSRKGT